MANDKIKSLKRDLNQINRSKSRVGYDINCITKKLINSNLEITEFT